jgi:hypothetical protein
MILLIAVLELATTLGLAQLRLTTDPATGPDVTMRAGGAAEPGIGGHRVAREGFGKCEVGVARRDVGAHCERAPHEAESRVTTASRVLDRAFEASVVDGSGEPTVAQRRDRLDVGKVVVTPRRRSRRRGRQAPQLGASSSAHVPHTCLQRGARVFDPIHLAGAKLRASRTYNPVKIPWTRGSWGSHGDTDGHGKYTLTSHFTVVPSSRNVAVSI